jgi:DNA polymerase III epsilon subunit-like protein
MATYGKRIITCFDTETTGLDPRSSRVIQLAWITYDIYNHTIVSKHNYIIRIDDDVNMSPDSEKCHKISMEKSKKEGKPIQPILKMLSDDMLKSIQIVAHNISFDIGMLNEEYKRNQIESPFAFLKNKTYCTMMNTIQLCKCSYKSKNDGSYYTRKYPPYYKKPKLIELYNYLFGNQYTVDTERLHNAMYDVLLTIKCYVMLKYEIDLYTVFPDEYSYFITFKVDN